MRNVVLYLLVLVLVSACERPDWFSPFNNPRSQVMAPLYCPESRPGTDPVVASGDTSVFVSGVRVPLGYDWQRDTAIGLGRGELVLFKDMMEVLAMPTGYDECVSTDPDTHHIIQGHLYSEFSTLERTVVKRDGGTVLEYEGREFLVGLLEKDGEFYTLGCLRSGDGFTYRKNGEILLKVEDGLPYGSFLDSSYPETGALYLDGSKMYFAYSSNRFGKSSHIVEDGKDNLIDAFAQGVSIEDVKMIGGKLYCAGIVPGSGNLQYRNYVGNLTTESSYVWSSCRVVGSANNVKYGGTGRYRYASGASTLLLAADTGTVSVKDSGDWFFCLDGDALYLNPSSYAGYYFFSRSCVTYCGGKAYEALTPQDGSSPFMRVGGKEYGIDLNGFLTAVGVLVSPPS